MEKIIEIPEGYEARIESNKVVIEPKPSEDERMIKLLIKWCHEHEKEEWFEYEVATYGDVLAWLEKQKIPEGSPTPDLTTMLVPKRYNEQKPAEWSDEDSRILYNVIAYVGYAAGQRGVRDDEFKEANRWLRSLRSQQKYEWSEEDEKALIQLIENGVTEAICKPGAKFHFEDEYAKELIEYIKAFNPAPHWKPNELQMKALLSKLPVVKGGGDKVQDILESLYDDLKKLM